MSPADTPPPQVAALLAEFDREADATRRMLAAIPDDQLAWRLHERGMSLGELGHHVASIAGVMAELIDAVSFEAGSHAPADTQPDSATDLLATFDSGMAAARRWLETLGDRVNEPWQVTREGEAFISMPRANAIRDFMFNHVYHHRGQLSAYLRAVGATVPPVYGPSADVEASG